MENTKSTSDSSKATEEDGTIPITNSKATGENGTTPITNTRRPSNSSYTDSLETDSQSLDQSSDHVETAEPKPKKNVSRLPVKTKVSKVDPVASDNDSVTLNCNENDTGDKKKPCKAKHGKLDCMECNNVGQHAPTRETITSRMRIEKSHLSHGNSVDKEEYLTPTQRKGQTIKDLKKQMKELEKEIEEKNQEVDSLKQSIGKEAEQIFDTKNQEIREIKDNLEVMKIKYEELTLSYEESVKAVNTLEETLREIREKSDEKEVYHKNMYLEMYEKGKRSAIFEREDELEMLAKSGKSKVTTRELQRKLSESQAELAKWQSLRRNEMYEVAEKPETEAETTLKFLKDSFFHFLTHDKDSDDHLRAMIQIFNFSEVQKKKITKSLHDRKKEKS